MQLQALAQQLNCPYEGDPTLEIEGVAALTDARPGQLSFVSDPKYMPMLEQTQASAVLILPDLPLPAGLGGLRTPQPRLLFAQALELFYHPFQVPVGIHPTAVVDPTVELGQEVAIGPHVVIGAGVKIGSYTQIHANVTVYPNVTIGEHCQLLANCVIHERSQMGHHCWIHSGAVIGDDGFGHVPTPDGRWYRMPQSGRVVIEDGVDVGTNTTIDRPSVGETRIGQGSKIDNLVQVGHGVKTGSDCVLVAQVGLAGGVELGRHVVLGGQVGVPGYIRLDDHVIAVGQTGITGNVAAGQMIAGYPHQPHRQWQRTSVALRQLPDLIKTVRRLQKRVDELERIQSLSQSEDPTSNPPEPQS